MHLFNSCITDENSQVNSAFKGEWIGSFKGDSSGDIHFMVSKEGGIKGSLLFLPVNSSENFDGSVNHNGKFDFNTKSNYIFSGYLNNDKTITGIWNRKGDGSSFSGSFSIQKK